jgi:hypothetical protein
VSEYPTTPLTTYREYPIDEMRQRVTDFYEEIDRRRTVREFSDRHVPRDIIETALRAAGTAPSGANLRIIGVRNNWGQSKNSYTNPPMCCRVSSFSTPVLTSLSGLAKAFSHNTNSSPLV